MPHIENVSNKSVEEQTLTTTIEAFLISRIKTLWE